jgi:SulP family sulfate permease
MPQASQLLRDGYGPGDFRRDAFGAVTAAVVALPLALAFGVASGAGAIAGLYGAIATGLFASLFGGTRTQISGPTGPMTVVMGAIIATHADSMPEAFTIVMLGGVLQMLFGLLRVGSYVTYTPVSVVSGFMSGVGVIIIALQSLPFIGQPSASNGVIGTLTGMSQLRLQDIEWLTFGFSCAALALIVYWPKRLGDFVPAPLGVLVIGTVVAALFLDQLPLIGAIPSALPNFSMPDVSGSTIAQMLQPAFILALLGSIDSLLTSLVADSVTKTQHDSDRELFGQGIGNIAAGLLGAIPGAGATMRTVVNIRAGGHTPISGILHACILLALVLGLGPVVSLVPHAVLAAILMKVGWDIIDWGYLSRIRRAPKEKVTVMLTTFALTVFVDLITAVAVGIVMASFVNSRGLARVQLQGLRRTTDFNALTDLSEEERALLRTVEGRVLLTLLEGSFSYASARILAQKDDHFASSDVVIYDFSRAGYVDPSAALAIDEMIELSQRSGHIVIICGLQPHVMRALDGMGVLERVPESQRFDSRRAAIEAAVAHCR